MPKDKLPEKMPQAVVDGVIALMSPYVPDAETRFKEVLLSPERDATPEEWHTRKDLSLYLQISVQTVDRLIKSGDMPHIKLRHSIRVSETALREYLASKNVS